MRILFAAADGRGERGRGGEEEQVRGVRGRGGEGEG